MSQRVHPPVKFLFGSAALVKPILICCRATCTFLFLYKADLNVCMCASLTHIRTPLISLYSGVAHIRTPILSFWCYLKSVGDALPHLDTLGAGPAREYAGYSRVRNLAMCRGKCNGVGTTMPKCAVSEMGLCKIM